MAGPIPSGSWRTRNQLTSSHGFSRMRSSASASFTCAASMNFRPPYFTNGMLRRVSSTSSRSLWWAARNRTACSCSGTPSSRCRSTVRHNVSDCSASSRQVRSVGTPLARAFGPERLLVPLRAERDHRVRRGQQRRRRAVVLLELHDDGAGEPLRELQDVAHRRRAEPVDRLRVVADDRQVPRRAGRAQPLEDVGLQGVRVLVLVDEHVVEHGGELVARLLAARERLPEQQEVVVVQDVLRALALGVGAEDLADAVGLVEAPGVVALQDVAELLAGVDGARVDRGERLLAREAAILRARGRAPPARGSSRRRRRPGRGR